MKRTVKKIAQGRIRREDRQRDAKERAAYTDALPFKDRINVITTRRGDSLRELKRLSAALGLDSDSTFKKIRPAKTAA